MEPLIFRNAMVNRLDKTVRLVSALRFSPGEAPPPGAPRLAPGPGVRVFGWDRAKNDFAELDGAAIVRLVSVQPQRGRPGDRPLVLETAEGSWTLRGELHMDATPAEITGRM